MLQYQIGKQEIIQVMFQEPTCIEVTGLMEQAQQHRSLGLLAVIRLTQQYTQIKLDF